ncbi:hypothetical protein [Oceanobacillus alkalisoli]|uniref:hypothetical protein n=1 Tax=Oceanobacillus alkalisoli TaxID=2925113 RepID=UPI001EE427B4|nr:hypothetical protein [Oceanobacillus alkalisoli]MCG5105036.1 hypothetical protein [Oceanobacillus alkalisoli]
MQTYIKDFRVRKSFSFGLYNAVVDPEIVSSLIATRALYCYIDDDFNMTRVKDGKLEKSKIDFHTEDYTTMAKLKFGEINIDDFESHYLAHISGEKLFRNFFFSKDEDYIDEYSYFIFQPIVIELEKETEYYYRIYPVVKVVNNEIVVVDFNYYPHDETETVEEFADRLLRIGDKIKNLKLPYTYFIALGLEMNKENGELFNFESNVSAVYNFEDISIRDVHELAEMFLSMLLKYEKYSWFGRTLISLDNPNLTDKQIQLIRNGFEYTENNPLYDRKLINFSEHPSTKFYVFEHITLTMGDIMDSYMPAAVLDEELAILNTKMIVYSKVVDDESLDELLKSKKELHLLKQQISLKYTNILKAHTVMDYAINNLFKINDQIDRIDGLADISFRQKEFTKAKRDSLFHFIVGFVSFILSMSVLFDYIVKPIYEIRFAQEITPLDTLLNYIMFMGVSGVVVIALYLFIMRKKKDKK